MERRNWFGVRPADEQEARERLMDAALRCVQRYGIHKTNLNDIARQAGVTRPTVYRYFENRDAILAAALARVGETFADRLFSYTLQFDEPGDQVVEAVLYCLRELPEDPQLSLLLDPDVYSRLSVRVFSTDDTLRMARRILQAALDEHAELLGEVDEIAEVITRFLLSLITMRGPKERSEAELRTFLQRRLLPAVGLAPPARTEPT